MGVCRIFGALPGVACKKNTGKEHAGNDVRACKITRTNGVMQIVFDVGEKIQFLLLITYYVDIY